MSSFESYDASISSLPYVQSISSILDQNYLPIPSQTVNIACPRIFNPIEINLIASLPSLSPISEPFVIIKMISTSQIHKPTSFNNITSIHIRAKDGVLKTKALNVKFILPFPTTTKEVMRRIPSN